MLGLLVLSSQIAWAAEVIFTEAAPGGLSFGSVAKCTVMLADIAEWSTFNGVYTQYFKPPYPARSAFGASGLALNARVEMECIAVKHD
jgi:enamine deaminase RidA (YjgF/YER057c/UK114 family)